MPPFTPKFQTIAARETDRSGACSTDRIDRRIPLSYSVVMSTILDETTAIEALGALAQRTRLAVFRSLVSVFPEGVPAGAIAESCGVPHNTMSTHLGILTRARLIRSERRGRTILFSANLEGFRQLMAFLAEDCCQGRPEICSPLFASLAVSAPTLNDACRPQEIVNG